jgi:hypothetical protein
MGVTPQQRRSQPIGALIGSGQIQLTWITTLGQSIEVSRFQQPAGHQLLAIQQPGIQSKAAGGAIGRAEGIRRGQGQKLPGLDAVICQPIKPLVRRYSKRAAHRRAG